MRKILKLWTRVVLGGLDLKRSTISLMLNGCISYHKLGFGIHGMRVLNRGLFFCHFGLFCFGITVVGKVLQISMEFLWLGEWGNNFPLASWYVFVESESLAAYCSGSDVINFFGNYSIWKCKNSLKKHKRLFFIWA